MQCFACVILIEMKAGLVTLPRWYERWEALTRYVRAGFESDACDGAGATCKSIFRFYISVAIRVVRLTWATRQLLPRRGSVGGPLEPFSRRWMPRLGMRGTMSPICSGEQKHRRHRGVGSANSSSFTQSSMPVFRTPSFKRTEGSSEEDV